MTTWDEYSAVAQRFEASRRKLQDIITQLKDVADHLENRTDETCFGNLPGEGATRLWPGCKSFDADDFPDPVRIQAALDSFKEAGPDYHRAWQALPREHRKHLAPPDLSLTTKTKRRS
ncbi:hypothetical protein [Novosphingobium jiangmenense]|uniref:Uncharacterized protein n=1 Tax=Novosphingobium jiangmenense TaxID=2791981 RepID=A0ABS0HFE2_9SPHN|nr:hypothetical protein [Novosphingobium jiangmenense]MBF9150883.1 hypothetical protein [Novosphingobium jiangmenense]